MNFWNIHMSSDVDVTRNEYDIRLIYQLLLAIIDIIMFYPFQKIYA
uniref:Uncharacterized protein n=1 Tax=Rhizophora mucronata TaxID=61149 RepID=A0A2P2NLZ4_RHIMU